MQIPPVEARTRLRDDVRGTGANDCSHGDQRMVRQYILHPGSCPTRMTLRERFIDPTLDRERWVGVVRPAFLEARISMRQTGSDESVQRRDVIVPRHRVDGIPGKDLTRFAVASRELVGPAGWRVHALRCQVTLEAAHWSAIHVPGLARPRSDPDPVHEFRSLWIEDRQRSTTRVHRPQGRLRRRSALAPA